MLFRSKREPKTGFAICTSSSEIPTMVETGIIAIYHPQKLKERTGLAFVNIDWGLGLNSIKGIDK